LGANQFLCALLLDGAATIGRLRLRQRIVEIALDLALLIQHLLAAIRELLQRLVETRLFRLIDLLQSAAQIADRFLRGSRLLGLVGLVGLTRLTRLTWLTRLARLAGLSRLLLLIVAVLAVGRLHLLQRLADGLERLRELLTFALFALARLAAGCTAARRW